MSAADDAAWRDAVELAPGAGLAEQFWMLAGTSAPTCGAKVKAHWRLAQ